MKKIIWISGCCDAVVEDGICSKCGKKSLGQYQGNYKRTL